MTFMNTPAAPGIVRSASVSLGTERAIELLAEGLGDELDAVILFASPDPGLPALLAEAQSRFAPARVIGCTTAGELDGHGYAEGELLAIGLPRNAFRSRAFLLREIHKSPAPDLTQRILLARGELMREVPDWDHEFAFLMIDGMSRSEDQVASELAAMLGPVPLFGGSAGDGERFQCAKVFHEGETHDSAAVLLVVRTRCPVKVFKTDHLVPTEHRMVVTCASPDTRVVHRINDEPAGREYARLLGKDPEQLTTFTFAAHPVVVRIGAQHHVRSIQQAHENGDLTFFSAVGEGLVLSLAEAQDMVDHLETELAALSADRVPDTILACDCLLRKLEAEQKQIKGKLSEVLARHRVVGFSTYGEQMGSMHVNQTLTGVAIYPPED